MIFTFLSYQYNHEFHAKDDLHRENVIIFQFFTSFSPWGTLNVYNWINWEYCCDTSSIIIIGKSLHFWFCVLNTMVNVYTFCPKLGSFWPRSEERELERKTIFITEGPGPLFEVEELFETPLVKLDFDIDLLGGRLPQSEGILFSKSLWSFVFFVVLLFWKPFSTQCQVTHTQRPNQVGDLKSESLPFLVLKRILTVGQNIYIFTYLLTYLLRMRGFSYIFSKTPRLGCMRQRVEKGPFPSLWFKGKLMCGYFILFPFRIKIKIKVVFY